MARNATAVLNAAVAAALVPGTTYYLSLHTADPGTTGANELSGGTYARQAIVFSTASSGAESNTALITVPNDGTSAVSYWGVWSASTGGTYETGGVLGSPVTAASISFAIGALVYTAA